MYSIGEFSKITSITIKALRHYHEKGLLIPSSVDANTRYRYYSQREVEKARVLITLKSFKFSLEEIEALLNGVNDDADIIQVLKIKRSQINADINSLKNVASALNSIIDKELEANKVTNTSSNIHIKTIPELLVVSIRWQGSHSDTGTAMGKIYQAGGRHSIGPALNLCYDGEYRDVADIESCLPIKKVVKSGLGCRKLPAEKCVSYLHKGSYENIGESYQRVFDYIKNNELTMKLPTREVYIKGPGMIFKGNSKNYLTELLIPIE